MLTFVFVLVTFLICYCNIYRNVNKNYGTSKTQINKAIAATETVDAVLLLLEVATPTRVLAMTFIVVYCQVQHVL